MAVGLTLKEENFEDFKKAFQQVAKEEKVENILPVIYIDGIVTGEDIKPEFVKQLTNLEPFGEGNRSIQAA